jgi:hypothetical protein
MEASMTLEQPLDDSLEKDRKFVTALARGLEVLSCFKAGDRFSVTPRSPSAPACPRPPSPA